MLQSCPSQRPRATTSSREERPKLVTIKSPQRRPSEKRAAQTTRPSLSSPTAHGRYILRMDDPRAAHVSQTQPVFESEKSCLSAFHFDCEMTMLESSHLLGCSDYERLRPPVRLLLTTLLLGAAALALWLWTYLDPTATLPLPTVRFTGTTSRISVVPSRSGGFSLVQPIQLSVVNERARNMRLSAVTLGWRDEPSGLEVSGAWSHDEAGISLEANSEHKVLLPVNVAIRYRSPTEHTTSSFLRRIQASCRSHGHFQLSLSMQMRVQWSNLLTSQRDAGAIDVHVDCDSALLALIEQELEQSEKLSL
ncbi:hypothetical protein BCR37DRAFT_5261 [Protomyces lactucae-debilis]|uniref:Uncharacterized protein n=1 Tax=Protomyces lactucae-debilis TaxID=2754530 RepID=A0A1Y2FUK3_PROLT|nr:uncharacterized protein BCR37DRAFT_5261 [Protomyces lactucae-debilis]ORY87678.1 hypothetical protein BCR37DRAFT_5261 [Protomyces lactucae-debilis]